MHSLNEESHWPLVDNIVYKARRIQLGQKMNISFRLFLRQQ